MSPQERMAAADFNRDRLVELPEAQFIDDVRQVAKARRWMPYHTHRSDRSDVGFPDLVLARKGRVVFAELKAVTGSWRDGQREFLAELAGDTPDDWHFDRCVYRWSNEKGRARLIVACWTPLSWREINGILT